MKRFQDALKLFNELFNAASTIKDCLNTINEEVLSMSSCLKTHCPNTTLIQLHMT